MNTDAHHLGGDLATTTSAMQDYLKAIYVLGGDTGSVATQHIAAHLGVASPSVTNMVKRLHALGFLYREPYHGVALTASGARVAIEVTRHHRLVERYLVEILGYPLDEVHAEAERLEHHLSEALEARIDAVLGHPTVDPHGDPIPSCEGALQAPMDRPLAALAAGDGGFISRVSDADPAKLRYVADCGLLPGRWVTVREVEPFNGPLRVQLGSTADGSERMLGHELAGAIFVHTAES